MPKHKDMYKANTMSRNEVNLTVRENYCSIVFASSLSLFHCFAVNTITREPLQLICMNCISTISRTLFNFKVIFITHSACITSDYRPRRRGVCCLYNSAATRGQQLRKGHTGGSKSWCFCFWRPFGQPSRPPVWPLL